MSDEKVVADVKEPEVQPDVKPETVDTVPYARFQEVNKKMRSLEDQLEKNAKAEKKRQEDLLIAEGEKDELISRLRSERDEAVPFKEKLETYMAGRREALIEQLPEDKRDKFSNVQDLTTLESIVSELSISPTPPAVSNDSPDHFGGYASLSEFAIKDPKGYEAERESNQGVWNRMFPGK